MGAGEGASPCWGGEVIGDLILRESEERRGARDVELGAFYFFGSKKILAGTDVWTPYLKDPDRGTDEAVSCLV